jgi:anti-sigma-K factor RskA
MNDDVSRDEFDELLALYALDALDRLERETVERRVHNDPRARAEIDALQETAAYLGLNNTAPPPGLWISIASELDGLAPPEHRRARHTRQKHSRVVRAIAAGLALAAAGTIALLSVEVAHQHDRVDRLAADMTRRPMEQAAMAALTSPGAHVVDLRSSDRAWSAHLVMRRDGTGITMKSNLSRLSPDRTYQLWAVTRRDGDYSTVSVSTLGREVAMSVFHIDGTVVGRQITEEAAPGAISPHYPPIVEASLPE